MSWLKKLKIWISKRKPSQVAALISSVLLGILLLVVLFLFLFSGGKTRQQVKNRATESNIGSPESTLRENRVASRTRPISYSRIKRKGNESDDGNTDEEISSDSEDSPRKQKQGGVIERKVPVRRKQGTNQNPPLQEPPKPEPEKQPETCEEWKAKFESLLASDVDASKGSLELDEALNKISEVCKEPLKDLVDYSRTAYEAKRDSCLSAIIAGEKDLKLLEKMLKGVQAVDPSYKDTPLALQFVQKFVPAFFEPFTKLETDALPDSEFATLAKESNKAFASAQIFAPYVPRDAPKDLADKCKHESFKHIKLTSYLVDVIQKAINASLENKAKKYIRILRVLKPKSRFAFPGLETLYEFRRALGPPLRSYLKIQTSKEKPVNIEELKSMATTGLQALFAQFQNKENGLEKDYPSWYVCQSNLYLLSALIWIRYHPQEGTNSFNAWMNTGFKTVGCPEFIKWIEDDFARNPVAPDVHGIPSFIFSMHTSISSSLLGSDPATSHLGFIQSRIMVLVSIVFQHSQPESVLRKTLLKYLKSQTVEDAKEFLNAVLSHADAQMLKKFDEVFLAGIIKVYDSKFSLSFAMMHLLYKQHEYSKDGFSPFEVKLKDLDQSESLENAFQLWTKYASEDEKGGLESLKRISKLHYIKQQIELIEREFRNTTESGKPTKLAVDYTSGSKSGLLLAFRAYIGARKFIETVNAADLQKEAATEFGFASFPPDRSSLTLETFQKNAKLHLRLLCYVRYQSYLNEWKSFDDVLGCMREGWAAYNEGKSKKDVISYLNTIRKQCIPGGVCVFDQASKKISCTAEKYNAILQSLAKLDKASARYCQDLLFDWNHFNDHEKFSELLSKEWSLINSTSEENLFVHGDEFDKL